MTRQLVASVLTAFLPGNPRKAGTPRPPVATGFSSVWRHGFVAFTLLAAMPMPLAIALQSSASQKPQANPPDEANPPEEDESLIPEKVPLNPMEAERSIRVGTFYMHKGKYRAALQRFELATKYNPSSPDAFFKVGEAEEKLKNADAAKVAFEKVVHLAPNTKLAQEAQKKIDKRS